METPCFLADFVDREAMNPGDWNNSQTASRPGYRT